MRPQDDTLGLLSLLGLLGPSEISPPCSSFHIPQGRRDKFIGLLEFIEFIGLLGFIELLDPPELEVGGALPTAPRLRRLNHLGLEPNSKCFREGGYLEGELFENNDVNEGIPTDLKKGCTATIPLVPRIPSGHYIYCIEVQHLV